MNTDTVSNIEFKKLSEKIIYNGRRKILSKEFQLPDGQVTDFETFYSPAGIAIIIPVTDKGNLVIVKQYRVGPEKTLIELPGGGMEIGESPEDADKRELLEETGYTSDNFQLLGNFYKDGYSNLEINFVLATNCKKVGNQDLDSTEFVEVDEMSIEEFKILIKNNNKMMEGHHVLGFYLAMEKLGKIA